MSKSNNGHLREWPYREAKNLSKSLKNRLKTQSSKSGKVIFQTGYGPSGLPHIGTFAEVARTSWLRTAFERISDEPTTLYAFSDDMDGLRKVPSNLPNPELIIPHLGKPLCDIPDPFGIEESFSAYMNKELQRFLDRFGFSYEFKSSQAQYRSGVFNEGLLLILERYDRVRRVVVPTLSPEKQVDWSPFMPICAQCGKVNSTRVLDTHPDRGTVSYICDRSYGDEEMGYQGCSFQGENPVIDGQVKVGWKVDWALRWFTFGVSYEMYGKDLIESAKLSSKICRILGGEPPEGMFYELFLDSEERKISKSIGNGISLEQWLSYGSLDSLGLFLFKQPGKPSRLHFDVIPAHMDEYLQHRRRWSSLSLDRQENSPLYFINHPQSAEAPEELSYETPLSFHVLLNLINVLNTGERELILEYIQRSRPILAQDLGVVEDMIENAIQYYQDFILPTKVYCLPDAETRPIVDSFVAWLAENPQAEAKEIQAITYQYGKSEGIELPHFFKSLYQLLLGQEQGPRIGTFIYLYGVEETVALAKKQLELLERD